MNLSKEEFDEQFRASLDTFIEAMAGNEEIDVNKFYGMTCFLENLAFFSPVLYGLLKETKE